MALGVVSLSPVLENIPLIIDDVIVNEGDSGITFAVFSVSLLGESANTVSVDFVTSDVASSTSGDDFTSNSGTLTFSPGDILQTITVQVLGDISVEDNEDFSIILSNPLNAVLGDGTGIGTITNDD